MAYLAWCFNATISFWLGGLGEAVLSAVGQEPGIVVTRLAVSGVPRSGKPQELLDIFGISAKHIAKAVRQTFANWLPMHLFFLLNHLFLHLFSPSSPLLLSLKLSGTSLEAWWTSVCSTAILWL